MSAMLREAGLLKELAEANERIRQLEAQSVPVVGDGMKASFDKWKAERIGRSAMIEPLEWWCGGYAAATPELATLREKAAILDKVFDAFGIGALVRTESALMMNIDNVKRREACLSEVERSLFTVSHDPYDDPLEDETDFVCLLNWGHGPIEYAETMRRVLADKRADADRERDVLRKDAERYRWIRTGDNDEQCLHFTNDCPAGTDTVWIHRNEKLDDAIDAAIAQGKGE